MGRDNHNAGIHMRPKNYKTPCDSIDQWDKYAEMLGSRKTKIHLGKPYGHKTTTQKIIENNDVIIWEQKGQEKVCNCGVRLEYSDKIVLSWSEENRERSVQVSGKYCTSCGRKYVVRKFLLVAIKMNH